MKRNKNFITGLALAGASLVCAVAAIELVVEKEVPAAVIAFIAAAALGGVAYKKLIINRKNRNTDDEKTQADINTGHQLQNSAHTNINSTATAPQSLKNDARIKFYKVAGVTFKNDDGSSRQRILKAIINESYGTATAELEEYSYAGDPAIRINTEQGCVGNIPADDVSEVLDLMNNKFVIACEVCPETFKDDETGKTIYRADVSVKYFDSLI